jgi:hypothetical protein
MSLSWVGIRLVRRLRLESAWTEKYSSPRPRAQLSGDGEAPRPAEADRKIIGIWPTRRGFFLPFWPSFTYLPEARVTAKKLVSVTHHVTRRMKS